MMLMIVIENDDNYVSEKLIDAFLGSSVPIYFGGDLEISRIPSHLVFSNFKNSEEILDFILKYFFIYIKFGFFWNINPRIIHNGINP